MLGVFLAHSDLLMEVLLFGLCGVAHTIHVVKWEQADRPLHVRLKFSLLSRPWVLRRFCDLAPAGLRAALPAPGHCLRPGPAICCVSRAPNPAGDPVAVGQRPRPSRLICVQIFDLK